MEEERYQKELFEFKQPRRVFPGFGKMHIKGDFALTLNLEKFIFAAIGIVMLLVIVYALGVERGKALQGGAGIPAAAEGQPPVSQVPRSAQKSVAMTAIPQTRLTGMAATGNATFTQPVPKQAVPAAVRADGPSEPAGPYTVLAVTLRKQDAAAAEAARLKSDGFDAFVRASGIYFQVCIGAFPTKDSAEKASVRVKRLYKDAYVITR